MKIDKNLWVYARDYYCDELYGESDNWCYTSYKAKLLPSGDIDIADLVKNMIDEGWLFEDVEPKDIKVVEKEERYWIYVFDNPDPEFYITK